MQPSRYASWLEYALEHSYTLFCTFPCLRTVLCSPTPPPPPSQLRGCCACSVVPSKMPHSRCRLFRENASPAIRISWDRPSQGGGGTVTAGSTTTRTSRKFRIQGNRPITICLPDRRQSREKLGRGCWLQGEPCIALFISEKPKCSINESRLTSE